jgi:hypothetical protein
MAWGLKSHPEAQISSFLRMPHKIFAKRLPAGEYSIFHIETKHRWWRADIRFSVSPFWITYIGSLQYHLYDTKKRGKFRVAKGTKKGNKCQVVITDNLDRDKQLFEKTFKIFNYDLDWKTTTNLMKGKIIGTREKRQKIDLPSIEKQHERKAVQVNHQPPESIDVFPST